VLGMLFWLYKLLTAKLKWL